MGKHKYVDAEEINYYDDIFRFENKGDTLRFTFLGLDQIETKYGDGWQARVTDIDDNNREKRFFCTFVLKNLLDQALVGQTYKIEFTGFTGQRKNFKMLKLKKNEDE